MFVAARCGVRLQPQYFTSAIRCLAAAVLLVGGGAFAQSLSFDAALQFAEQHYPDIAARTAEVAGTRAAASAAGRLPDPKLIVGIDNLPATGPDQWSLTRDFMTMRKIGVMQEVPNGALRRAQHDVATAAIGRAAGEQRVAILAIRNETASAWLTRYYLERRGTLFDALERENTLFADTVAALLAGGKGMPADVLIPKQEAAELADRRDELNASIAKAKAMLRRYVGDAGEDPLSNDAPNLVIDAEHLRAHVHEHPELAVYAPMLTMAQAEVREAVATKRPDWGVELAYAKRGPEFSDMVSLQVTIGLPLFTAHRQEPQIEAKRQAVIKVNAERDAMLRDHIQELDAELADYDTLMRQLTRMQDTRLPLAQQKVDYQFASYRAGKGDLNAVLNARRELIEQRLKQLDLESARAVLITKLYFSYGEGAQ